ncbi:MAG: SGNH/GDSL hydrolase family protein [Promethearchaeota archaeon]
MRVLILGNGSVLPRLSKNIQAHETFGFLMKEYLEPHGNDEVFIIGTHINNTYFQSIPARLLYDFKQFEPNIVILHLGINDCLPRLLTKEEMIMINLKMVKFKNNKFLRYYSKIRYYLLKFRKNNIGIKDFKKNYEKIIKEIMNFGSIPILINIPKPQNPTFRLKDSNSVIFHDLKDIIRYNEIIHRVSEKYKCILIDLYSMTENDKNLLLPNNFYLSKLGHQKLAHLLIDEIKKFKINVEPIHSN